MTSKNYLKLGHSVVLQHTIARVKLFQVEQIVHREGIILARADQIKALIQSHLQKDSEHFVTVALQLAASEARKGHSALANDIRNLIDSDKKNPMRVISISGDLDDLVQLKPTPNNFSSLVVSRDIKVKLKRIVREYFQSEKLAKHGLANRRKILLYGPPGTGKTMTAGVLAKKISRPLFVVQIDRLVTKYLGETSAKLRQIFTLIRERPGVYFFDEFDAIGSDRGGDDDVGEMRRVLNSLLQFIELDNSNNLIIAATNRVSSLDSALFRRFDDLLSYDKPERQEIELLIRNRLNVFATNYCFETLVKASENLSHAEITQACNDALKCAILENRNYVTQPIIESMLEDRSEMQNSIAI